MGILVFDLDKGKIKYYLSSSLFIAWHMLKKHNFLCVLI